MFSDFFLFDKILTLYLYDFLFNSMKQTHGAHIEEILKILNINILKNEVFQT